jgi:hypothetical protein
MAQRDAQQSNCNHLKGGTGAEAFLRGLGDSPYYAVIKHKLPSGVRRLYPGYLIWSRSLIRLAMAAVLYFLRPREALGGQS